MNFLSLFTGFSQIRTTRDCFSLVSTKSTNFYQTFGLRKKSSYSFTPRRQLGPCDLLSLWTFCMWASVTRSPVSLKRRLEILGLFAGTLYYETFSIYQSLRQFLGLVTEKYRNIPEDQVTNGGFVNSATRQAHSWPVDCPFQSCPLEFLGAILDIRCKSHGYIQTHAARSWKQCH
ncbi:hypothetical protein BDV33DRAFT_80405 [Aspergillus novoparasiticus]|uniref:Uncharacterized protein n=1 Tax=Aspergillus novoparasiticus TaxID=986946 RepID=A0A5N6E9N4_9EURO|nr:hypothetical protein BDV33DRAFT_80405 [Aspergillus novoparasiticus]